jgi:predicted phage terminase large subunit-like protein
MDLEQVKLERVQKIREVLAGTRTLAPDVVKVLASYGKSVKDLLPSQILAIESFTANQVKVIMELLHNPNFLAPQPTSQELFLNVDADIVLYGGAAGSGKTHSLLMDALSHIDDPNFYGVYFRRTTTQLEGGLWPAAKKLYSLFGGRALEKPKTIVFPSGARIKFAYMDLEKHADGHQGVEYSAIYWDEFTHFTWYQVSYLMTRMRSAAKGNSYMKCSMNPDKTHFVLDWVQPYLDKDGYPIRSLSGKIRWYVMKGGVMHSAWERDEILEQFPLDVPKTYTFISGDIDDNPILDFIEPSYRSTLENNTPVNVARLRYGNWYAMPEGSNYFSRDWCDIVDQPPLNAKRVRSWDLAATLPSEVNPDPDWTAGVKMSKDLKTGIYYIEHVVRFRDRPSGVEDKLLSTADNDGFTTGVTVPQDPGAAGKSYSTDLIRKFAERGYRCRTKPTNKDKVTRFAPFSAAAEAGLVCVVRGDWNDRFFTELESFTGDGKGKDDQVDATSDAFITLAEQKTCPVPNMSGAGLYKKNQLSGIR